MSDVENESPYMTIDEVAAQLRVSPSTVRRLAMRGEIPAVKVASIWRIPKGAAQPENWGKPAYAVTSDGK